MENDNLQKFIKKDYFLLVLLVLSALSLFRSLVIPLHGDELTYFKISEQLITGKYYLQDQPSTVTPIIPFLFAFFPCLWYNPVCALAPMG